MRALFVSTLSLFSALSFSSTASATFVFGDDQFEWPGKFERPALEFEFPGLNGLPELLDWDGRSLIGDIRGGKQKYLELEDYSVKLGKRGRFGRPDVAADDSLVYRPKNMSVHTRSKYKSKTFSTSLTVLPSSDVFQFDTLSILEFGTYKYRGYEGAEPSAFEFSVSLFISDYNDPFSYEHLLLETTIQEDENTGVKSWELSGEFDISDYAEGFFLTIENHIGLDPGVGAKYLYARKSGLVLGISGNETVVPVPAAAWLFGSAILGMVLVRRA